MSDAAQLAADSRLQQREIAPTLRPFEFVYDVKITDVFKYLADSAFRCDCCCCL